VPQESVARTLSDHSSPSVLQDNVARALSDQASLGVRVMKREKDSVAPCGGGGREVRPAQGRGKSSDMSQGMAQSKI